MGVILAGLALVLPLVIAPGVLFFDDVTPKGIVVLLAAASCLAWWIVKPAALSLLLGGARGKLVMACIVAWSAVIVITTVTARSPDLAWAGSTWRGFGALIQLSILVVSIAAAAEAYRNPSFVLMFCRALCVSGIVAAIYGILQYAGVDPLLSGAGYHAGEGPFRIVRPPSTLGHADYFAAFLLWPAFAGFCVRGRIGLIAVLSSSAGIIVSGSRGALLGLIVGVVCWIALTRPRPRVVAYSGAAAIALCAIFAVSPAGTQLQARLHWIGEEPSGGARLLLWRDTLAMVRDSPLLGYGRENFVAEFPKYQSVDLSRAYPDFYHESPHNLLLDELASDGVPGLIALGSLIALAALRGFRRATMGSISTAALLAGLAASVIAHQFIVLTPPTAFCIFAVVAMLAVERSESEPLAGRSPFRPALRMATPIMAAWAIAFLAFTAFRIGFRDYALENVRRDLDSGHAVAAAGLYERLAYRPPSAELYMSRRFAVAAKNAPTAISKVWLVYAANRAAERSTLGSEQRPNAWYNVAAFAATSNDVGRTEAALKQAIRYSPNWYKPHWAMARLMHATGHEAEAGAEARRALELDGGKDEEVSATLALLSVASQGGSLSGKLSTPSVWSVK